MADVPSPLETGRRAKTRRWGNGAAVTWLREHVTYQGDGCLIWPFARKANGRGNFGFKGKSYRPDRFMCDLANGPPPTPRHEAAHSCGNGHLGCVSPRHLSWKTKAENAADCKVHGTSVRNRFGPRGRLTPEQVASIRAVQGKETQQALAHQFGCGETTIRDIFAGRTWVASGDSQ